MLYIFYTTLSAVLFSLTCFTNAQTPTLPACAGPCITNAVANVTTCGLTDTACQCTTSNQALIEAASTTCVLESCGTDGISAIVQAAQAICSAALASSVPTGSAAATSLLPASTYPGTAQPTSVPVPISRSCGCGGEPATSYTVLTAPAPTTATATSSPTQATGAGARVVHSAVSVVLIGVALLCNL